MEKTVVRSTAWRWCSALALCMAGFAAQARDNGPASVAFWYADNPPLPELAQFDWTVVEPGHLTSADVETLRRLGSQPFAYLSIGEFDGDRAALQRNALTQAASAMRNQAWNSQVMDLTTDAWREHLFKRAAALKAQGYSGLFLDTLDSFQLLPKADQEAQRKALASLLRELHRRQPQLKLFFNRGFEVLGELDGVASAVAVESIHAGWDPGAKRYRPVPADDQQWLEGKLKPLREKNIPLVAIDYLPSERREEARKLAKQLSQEGFTPVISTPDLDGMSLSTVEVQPRRIAMLYDPREGDLTENPGHLFLGGLLEYLGYRVDYLPTDQPLPQHRFDGLYAGVVLWMTNGVPEDSSAFYTWVNKRLDEQVPLAIFAGLPIEDGALLQRLGLSERAPGKTGPLQVVSQDDSLVGKFEAPLVPRSRGLTLVSAKPDGPTPGLVLSDGQNRKYTPIVTAEWGGMALAPYVIETNAERSRWVLDPFAFVQKALRLPMQPRPDTTTENGRRIATVHIDGDGFPSRAEIPGTPYSGRVVLDDFIRANPYLTSVSIIEGETSPKGMFPYLAKELEPLAREVLADPKVEVATHTYSHPFFLQPEKTVKRDDFHAEYGLHLKIPGYDKLDFRREIVGSRDYINSRLTTPQKPVKMVFWPGDALPSGDTIKIAYDAGLANVNGGQTIMTNANPSLTGLSPLLRPTSGGMQYYAPIINENMYTNLWKGPYYGFRDVIDTFQLTDKPRRLRGLHLYYHFYSGTKEASIKVMADIYKHMNAQQPISLWMSDYLPRLHGLYQSSLARNADGSWQVRGMDGLRTLRLDAQQGWPDLGRSEGVAGVRDLPQGRYVHLSDDHARLVLRPDRDPRPALEEASLPLTQWRYLNDQQVSFGFDGQTDLRFSVRSAGACSVQVNGKQFTGKAAQGLWHFQLPYRQVSDAKLSCN
ncbi:bifunctional glycoside hydrolase 114/ polysaccharide deacetylase family protein [Pseudomonas sp. JQ170]|uniref:bifunctional glycoside hydrolase 114/ polysaccharide deacetylase family protein n=1 Tax=unclassified Pseudomonas TaxID=196821 RepID=UPI0026538076|nr:MULTISPECIES: bifunctional glycoside hydrolase 114/ polysaccharide deacetylase family protein [unclassified Pseudomonas]MDN7143437.1 bifunctional glycoside hydrolase 114/ polysaccharide deacetylase family protein [Pseudomonas sp. JQ170]WRO73922.1 bifunctional glycoside hydrolase 114/ polysaccharide deacetylase family protein [Pseudomonas sp. 170C]